MGIKLTDAELKVVRCALKSYRDLKAADAKKKKNADKADSYEKLLVIVDDVTELFDEEKVYNVYVNQKNEQKGM